MGVRGVEPEQRRVTVNVSPLTNEGKNANTQPVSMFVRSNSKQRSRRIDDKASRLLTRDGQEVTESIDGRAV